MLPGNRDYNYELEKEVYRKVMVECQRKNKILKIESRKQKKMPLHK